MAGPRRPLRKPPTNHRISARVDPDFYAEVSAFADALGITIPKLIVQALQREASGFSLREQCQRLMNANAALTERKQLLQGELKYATEALKDVAKRLEVPATAADCLQRIGEIQQKLQTTADTLDVVKGDRDQTVSDRDSYQNQRDCFKTKHEESQASLRTAEAKLAGYRRQGLWGRLLGRVPDLHFPASE